MEKEIRNKNGQEIKVPANPLEQPELMIRQGQRSKAEKFLKGFVSNIPSNWKPIEESPDRVKIAFWDMDEFLAYKAYQKIKKIEKEVLWITPSYSKAFYLLGFIAVEREDWSNAMKYIDRGLKLEPDHPLLLCEKAMILSRMGRHGEAYKLFMKASDSRSWAPANLRARALRGAGVALVDLRKLDEAEKLLKKCLELEPENVVAKNELAYIKHLQSGGVPTNRYDLASTAKVEKEHNLKNDETYTANGISHLAAGLYLEALKDFNQAIKLNPNNVNAYMNRGIVYTQLEQHQKALEDYNHAIELDPKYAQIYVNRGALYSYLGHHQRALEDFNQAINLNPKLTEAYINRGSVYSQLGQHQKALEDYDRAIALNPTFVGAYYNRGHTYEKLGQLYKALKNYDRAIKLNTKYVNAYMNRGNVYYALGQYQKALGDYDRVIELNPRFSKPYGARGMTYIQLNQLQRAFADFKIFMELSSPNDPGRRLIQQLIRWIEPQVKGQEKKRW